MDSVKDRLEKAVEIANVRSRRALAKVIGVPYDTMNKWIIRENITASGVMKITAKVPISRTYLETGEGDPQLDDTGVSNYGHDSRTEEMLGYWNALDNEDREHLYHLMKKLSGKKNGPDFDLDEGDFKF